MKDQEYRRLDQLLQKYHDGTESDSEFHDLILLLADARLPERYVIARDTILSVIAGTGASMADHAIVRKIEDQFISNITDRNGHNIRTLYYYLAGVAATVAVLVSLWLIYQPEMSPADTFDDPRVAYIETVKVLNTISGNINKGTDILARMEPGIKMEKGIRSLDAAGKLLERGIGAIPVINAPDEVDEVKR